MTLKRNKPLQRGAGLRRTGWGLVTSPRRPLPRRSKAKDAYERELDSMRPAVLERSGGRCEAQLPGCLGAAPVDIDIDGGGDNARALNVHHRLERSQGGGNELVNLLHCCPSCHNEGIHVRHKALSYELGLLLHHGQDPEKVKPNVRREEEG